MFLKLISGPGYVNCVFVNKGKIQEENSLLSFACLLTDRCYFNSWHSLSFDGSAVGQGTTLVPVPACREDFLRMKLTSFGKLLERTCCHIKNVRLCSETDQKSGNSGVAPDAV